MNLQLNKKGFSYKAPKVTLAKVDLEKQKAFIESYNHFLKETPDDE